MVKLTLLELNFDGAQFSAMASRGERTSPDATAAAEEAMADDTSGTSRRDTAVGALVGLAFLVGLAALLRRYHRGDEAATEVAVVERR